MTITSEEYELYECALRFYLPDVFVEVTDFTKVINNRTKINEDIYLYPCPGVQLYLKTDGYAANYPPQKIQNGKVYYKNKNATTKEEDSIYEYLSEYEWHNTSLDHLEKI